ncbi:hypothetical protein ANCCAN_27756 [Ancylostoma caninum]|uniref:Uncharacterized protein n=1 Tax=Ancylostoma caninum TaxID=29170 RepID=A0A368F8K1_ANCCA|nr:hypothetical protein ANCCAN_27756 [Ancylostoma caninum]
MPNGLHGGVDVGIWADGPFAELFSSTIENTDVAYIIKFLLCTNNTDYTICSASSSTHGLGRAIVARMGADIIVISGIVLILITILSFAVAVIVIIFLVMQRRRYSRRSDWGEESSSDEPKSPV